MRAILYQILGIFFMMYYFINFSELTEPKEFLFTNGILFVILGELSKIYHHITKTKTKKLTGDKTDEGTNGSKCDGCNCS